MFDARGDPFGRQFANREPPRNQALPIRAHFGFQRAFGEQEAMRTVKSALAHKGGTLIHVRSSDMVVEAQHRMRDNRVRSVLVIDDDVLVGIVTQGDCAIRVLLPVLDGEHPARHLPAAWVGTCDRWHVGAWRQPYWLDAHRERLAQRAGSEEKQKNSVC
jgi:hypothetical protein